jgi:hypothetical protein
MKRVSISLALAFALNCGVAQSALAQDGLDVTMRVLDDVKDVDAVVREIAKGKDTSDGDRRRDDDAAANEHSAAPNGDNGLDEGEIDHGDGKYEDHDVPSDEAGQ